MEEGRNTSPAVTVHLAMRWLGWRRHEDWAQLLIEEYATLQGQAVPTPDNFSASGKMFKAAVQYVHVNLLQDLPPPWIGHDSPQALPGDGVLARYLKPTFLSS